MSLGEQYQLAIIAFIVIVLGYLIWRGGAKNPVGTGGLDRRVTEIKTKVTEIEGRVEKIERKAASAEDIARLEKQLLRLTETLPDIEARQRALSDKMGEHAKAAAVTATKVDHIDRQVGLIYQVLVPKGMEK